MNRLSGLCLENETDQDLVHNFLFGDELGMQDYLEYGEFIKFYNNSEKIKRKLLTKVKK